METNSRDVGVGTANTRVSTLSVDISDNDLGISDGYFVKETHFLCLHTTSLYIDFNMYLCLQRRVLRTVPMLGGKQGMHVHANEELKWPINKGRKLIGNNVNTKHGGKLQCKIIAPPLLCPKHCRRLHQLVRYNNCSNCAFSQPTDTSLTVVPAMSRCSFWNWLTNYIGRWRVSRSHRVATPKW